jgi:hypothetical protein
MKRKSLIDVQIWRRVIAGFPIGKVDILRAGRVVDVINSKGSYSFIESPARGWIYSGYLMPVTDAPPPVPAGDIWWTIRGYEKPHGYKPADPNYTDVVGSFDPVWLMENPKISKPHSINLTARHLDYLRWFNGRDEQKIKWLVAQDSTKKVLSVDDKRNYRIPVPCCSGNSLVRVVEFFGNFARIETVDINAMLPTALPSYLYHTWWAFNRGGIYYQPHAATGGVKYPLFFNGSSAWIQRGALKEVYR